MDTPSAVAFDDDDDDGEGVEGVGLAAVMCGKGLSTIEAAAVAAAAAAAANEEDEEDDDDDDDGGGLRLRSPLPV